MNPELENAYISMGTDNERQYLPIIKNLYGADVKKTSYRYASIDFVGNNLIGEMKSRCISLNDYNETMIGFNKITKGFQNLNTNKRVFFWFAFKDGLYEWELTNETYDLNGGINQKRYGGTKNRGVDDFKDHYYIKTKFLKKIDDTPVIIHPSVRGNYDNKQVKKVFKSVIPEGVCFLKLVSKVITL